MCPVVLVQSQESRRIVYTEKFFMTWRCYGILNFKSWKTTESQSLSQSCHCSLNNHPDKVNSKAVLPTFWLIKLTMMLGSESSKYVCWSAFNMLLIANSFLRLLPSAPLWNASWLCSSSHAGVVQRRGYPSFHVVAVEEASISSIPQLLCVFLVHASRSSQVSPCSWPEDDQDQKEVERPIICQGRSDRCRVCFEYF